MINFAFKPYLGIGMGYAGIKEKGKRHVYHFGWFGFTDHDSINLKQDSVAWQAIAGISYPICQKTELSLEYRYFQADNLKNNKIGLVLSRYF
jgi:opacity protein-like surface antigen